MIILRSLIYANVLKLSISNPEMELREMFYTGLSEAIYYYLNIQKKLRLVPMQSSVGVVAQAPTPVPGSGLAAIKIKIPDKNTLKDNLLNNVTSSNPLPNPELHTKLFLEISTWLNGPMQISIGQTSVPPTMQGSGTCAFPLMATLGSPSWAVMTALGITGVMNSPLNYYEILSNFIYLGLASNFSAPIMTLGQALPPTGAYTGTTIITPWIFLDVFGWPVGGLLPLALLVSLGLDSFMDESGTITDEEAYLQSQIDEDEENQALEIEEYKCDLQFVNGEYVANPNCDEDVIGEILSTGAVTSATLDEESAQIMTSASLENINLNYLSTSSDTLNTASPDFSANTPEPEYESFRMVGANSININIGQPTVITTYVKEITVGFDRQTVFEVF